MPNLSAQLSNYLKSNASPLSGHVPALIRAGRRWRVDPRLIVAISNAETSLGKAGDGPKVFNAWGIGPGRAYQDWQHGINEMAKLLRTGYLNDGRHSLAQIYPKYVWGKADRKGDPQASWVRNASETYAALGGNPGKVTRGWQNAASPYSSRVTHQPNRSPNGPVMPDFAAGALETIAGGGSAVGALRSMLSGPAHWAATHPAPAAPPARPASAPAAQGQGPADTSINPNVSSLSLGKIIGTPHSGTHTLGNWQSDNAYDVAMPTGTPIRADFNGVVGSNIGPLGKAGSRFAGSRVQIDGQGNSVWYGHLSRYVVRPGQRVQKGQIIGYSGSANGVEHLHVGFLHLPSRSR